MIAPYLINRCTKRGNLSYFWQVTLVFNIKCNLKSDHLWSRLISSQKDVFIQRRAAACERTGRLWTSKNCRTRSFEGAGKCTQLVHSRVHWLSRMLMTLNLRTRFDGLHLLHTCPSASDQSETYPVRVISLLHVSKDATPCLFKTQRCKYVV